MRPDPAIERVWAQAYTVPTDFPEADGTASWTSTTIIVVHVQAGGLRGVGYTYTDASVAAMVGDKLATVVTGLDAMDPPAAWRAMQAAVRNLGREGLAATAISAVDTALWDLKGRLLNQSLVSLLGRYREAVPIYGSGGFTSYDDTQLAGQLAGWVGTEGCCWVKMKIGADPDRDPARVAAAKTAIGAATLFVDANGGYRPQAGATFGASFRRKSGCALVRGAGFIG